MKEPKKYKIHLTSEAKGDILEPKKYILNTFKYRETAERFTEDIRHTILQLTLFPAAYPKTGVLIQGDEVYYKPHNTYLIFYVIKEERVIIIRIIKDRMYWHPIIRRTHLI